MENKKQTAVEWLYHKIVIQNSDVLKFREYYEQAKEMERMQSVDDFTCGTFEGYKGANGFPSMLVNDYITKKYNT